MKNDNGVAFVRARDYDILITAQFLQCNYLSITNVKWHFRNIITVKGGQGNALKLSFNIIKVDSFFLNGPIL